jgi:carbonic anhydrase/acetyltransferase-like protein (isoleucine patch superfamily)
MSGLNVSFSARVFGEIIHGEGCYLAQGVIIRSSQNGVVLGDRAWILENSVIVGSEDAPTRIGSNTVLGHKCQVMNATIGNWCEVGNNVIVMPKAKIGDWCIFGEGTLIPEGIIIPDESVVVGRPGKIIRKINNQDRETIKSLRGDNLSDEKKILIKEGDKMARIYSFNDKKPVIAENCVLFDTAEITGDVIIDENTIIGAGVKIIGDSHGPVRIGKNVQILENTVLHLLPDNQLIIEDDVIIGPGAMIHGCYIETGSIIESGAIICDNSKIGRNCLVKAGTLVKQREVITENSVIEGFPGRIVDTLVGQLTKPAWAL